MECPSPSGQAAVRRTTVTWAALLAEDIDRLRAEEDKRLQEEADAAAKQKESAARDADARIAVLKASLGQIPASPIPNEMPKDPADAGGFALGGLIRHSALKVALPSLKLQLLDEQGTAVLPSKSWFVDSLGKYRVELSPGEVQKFAGTNLRLEVLDSLGARVLLSGPIPRIDVGCAKPLDLEVPAGATKVVDSIAMHAVATKETLDRTKKGLETNITELGFRKTQLDLDLGRKATEFTDRKQSLSTGKGSLMGKLSQFLR